ncbi:UNVERIFIED_CONTAM: amino acid transporter [Acetivibrio alkalicellulosi]
MNKGLKTLEGVYVPTLLTILGVVMYLRLGWVVGNSGLIGALAIICIAHVITISTTLSMSSMLTNIKIGSGGAYAIVSQSLGLEMGGAIGIPLYFCQAISVAFYITGFTELWKTFFPHHPIIIVSIITWLVLAGLSIYSAKLAFKVQYVILAAVIASIFSFVSGSSIGESNIQLIGSFESASFWQTFAIFFPAVTGILTGATMSGELENPRKSIIKGTLAAVFTGFLVYGSFALLFSQKVPTNMLLENNLIILDISSISIFVTLGIMGAVLSSALSTLVSAPRTLSALAENRSVPLYNFLSKKTKKGEPKNAIILSSLLSAGVLLLGNLDSLANILTLFFLTTYAMINLVILLEKITGIVSFRPSLSISTIVPVIGLVGCLFSMFLINKYFVIVTFIIIFAIYFTLQKKNIYSPWGDIRGGIFYSIAEWAGQKAMAMPYHPKLWKPSIVIPVETPEDFKRITFFVKSFIYPSGRAYYLTINQSVNNTEVIKEVLSPLKEQKLFAQDVIINGGDFDSDLSTVLQSLSSTFLPPNSIFFTISDDSEKQRKFQKILKNMAYTKMGLMCLHIHPKYNFGQNRNIHLWLRDKSPNNNLAVLSALQISKNWNANVTLCRVVSNKNNIKKAESELYKFIEDARLPVNSKILVVSGKFHEILPGISSDLNILGISSFDDELKFESMINIINLVQTSVLFVSDSGLENALA